MLYLFMTRALVRGTVDTYAVERFGGTSFRMLKCWQGEVVLPAALALQGQLHVGRGSLGELLLKPSQLLHIFLFHFESQ